MLDIDNIEREANNATKGPWHSITKKVEEWEGKCGVQSGYGLEIVPCACDWEGFGYGASYQDAEFIAHSRTNVPALCAEIRRYRAAYEKQIPKKVVYPNKNYSGLPMAECPVCGCRGISYAECFCARCGQKLDWSENDG